MWLWILQVMFQEDLMSTEIGPIRRLQVWRDCHPRARGSFVQAKFSCMCTSILLAGTCANLSLQPMYPHQQLWVHMSCAPNLAMSSPGPYAPPASLKVVLDQVNLCAKKWGKSMDASEPQYMWVILRAQVEDHNLMIMWYTWKDEVFIWRVMKACKIQIHEYFCP